MKYLKNFENKLFKPPKKHDPKHKYDCENCKFNWCCGFECSCMLEKPDAPSDSLYGSTKKFNL